MSELFMGILTDKDIKALNEQGFNIYNKTRVDRYIMRYYLSNQNNDKIYYHCFEPSSYGIELLSNQTNERINTMTNLTALEKLKALGTKKIDNNTIENRKGIIQQSTDLTIQKFSAIDNMVKKFESIEKQLSMQSEKINQVYIDLASIVKGINEYGKLQTENNSLLINIASQLSKISTIKTVKIEKKNDKVEPARENINIETNDIDIEKLYQSTMKNFLNRKIYGSKKLDKVIEFTNMINNINMNDLDNSLSEFWASEKSEGRYIYGAPLKGDFILALKKAYSEVSSNKTITNETIGNKGKVYSKRYFITLYKPLTENDIDSIIEVVKTNGLNDTIQKMIYDILEENVSDEIQEFNQFINWLKGFIK